MTGVVADARIRHRGGRWWQVFRIAAVARARDEQTTRICHHRGQVADGGGFSRCTRRSRTRSNINPGTCHHLPPAGAR